MGLGAVVTAVTVMLFTPARGIAGPLICIRTVDPIGSLPGDPRRTILT